MLQGARRRRDADGGRGARALVPGARAPARVGAGRPPAAALKLPPTRRVLELFLYGGLCPWDTFYCVPGWGAGAGRYLHAFDVASRATSCAPEGVLAGDGGLTRPFASDAQGVKVHLGPWTWPLWSRPDVLARARVIVTRHDQQPHATAIPLALTGVGLGRPELAGTGAHVQHRLGALDPNRVAPLAAVVRAGTEPVTDNLSTAAAVGLLPDGARPLELNLATLPLLVSLLERSAVNGGAAAHDALVRGRIARARARLAGARSAGLDAFAQAHEVRARADELASLLPPSIFGLPISSACGELESSTPRQAAGVATHLLTRPEDQAARYALWIDSGLRPTYDGGHDTHASHLDYASRNYPHTLAALLERINAPGEQDPDKLELDDTLIAITSEFGRTPWVEDARAGLGHWSHGYVTVLIGGPIAASAAGVVGAIEEESGRATSFVSPAELRMGLLLALGIDPLTAPGFGVSSVRAASDEGSARAWLASTLFGVTEGA
ncbi:MAG: DUF1501 domain-containing protein [Myxococcales bacterium]|nr:DUF1501 domain-containing protein [Myxococcales bacterium]